MQGAHVNLENTRIPPTSENVAVGLRSSRLVTPGRWFAICTRSRRKKRVAERLTGGGLESFFPAYKAERWTQSCRVPLNLPLFPGHLLVHISPQGHSLYVSGHPCLVAGTKARIEADPFPCMDGVVLRNKNGLRVVLTVDLVMQSVAAQVKADGIETGGSYARD